MTGTNRGQKTKRVVSDFLSELLDFLSEQEILELAFGRIALDETSLQYKPEAFVRHNLVHPLLEVTGFSYQIEPISDTHQKKWTDFEITNTDVLFIGEVKSINDLQGGEQELRSYLGEEGFDTPYGILTDGLTWRFYGPRVEGQPGYMKIKEAGLENCLLLCLDQTETRVTNALSTSRLQAGIEQAQIFGGFMNRDSLDSWALERLPKEVRDEYHSSGRPLQTSLAGYWSK